MTLTWKEYLLGFGAGVLALYLAYQAAPDWPDWPAWVKQLFDAISAAWASFLAFFTNSGTSQGTGGPILANQGGGGAQNTGSPVATGGDSSAPLTMPGTVISGSAGGTVAYHATFDEQGNIVPTQSQ